MQWLSLLSTNISGTASCGSTTNRYRGVSEEEYAGTHSAPARARVGTPCEEGGKQKWKRKTYKIAAARRARYRSHWPRRSALPARYRLHSLSAVRCSAALPIAPRCTRCCHSTATTARPQRRKAPRLEARLLPPDQPMSRQALKPRAVLAEKTRDGVRLSVGELLRPAEKTRREGAV